MDVQAFYFKVNKKTLEGGGGEKECHIFTPVVQVITPLEKF